MMWSKSLRLALLLCAPLTEGHDVEVIQVTKQPLVSFVDGTSKFRQVFNPAFVEASPTSEAAGLLIRTQDCRAPRAFGDKCDFCGGSGANASRLTFVPCDVVQGTCENSVQAPVDDSSVVFGPSSDEDFYGTEDPRVKLNPLDGYHYMFYTAYGKGSPSRSVILSLAKTRTPTVRSSWQRLGPVFTPTVRGSKSAALLVEDDRTQPDYGTSYLYWGDSMIRLLKSSNASSWSRSDEKDFIKVRPDGFDSNLVESGPPPLKLRDGNWLFFYNSAETGWPKKGAYHPGFVIINGSDKTQILQRSAKDKPLLSPNLPWQKGTLPYTCNAPNVIFVEAAVMFTEQQKKGFTASSGMTIDDGDDLIRIYFGGSDAVVGTAVARVAYSDGAAGFV
eukprot:gb/GFBE01059516.1/.p1 GENE.gb/GFBE01059516.1/~~gb/GFBE01059516.1/.p1  ORF type:complete len:389 (+),score=77.20 gb/GFBE01059516.1/:1-1167(+)